MSSGHLLTLSLDSEDKSASFSRGGTESAAGNRHSAQSSGLMLNSRHLVVVSQEEGG